MRNLLQVVGRDEEAPCGEPLMADKNFAVLLQHINLAEHTSGEFVQVVDRSVKYRFWLRRATAKLI